jgi:hypothetical protein
MNWAGVTFRDITGRVPQHPSLEQLEQEDDRGIQVVEDLEVESLDLSFLETCPYDAAD